MIGPRVLITGGTGSLGQAIVGRGYGEGWDAEFTVYSRDEVKQAAMAEAFPGVRFLLGDVQDADALGRAMRGIDTVIHAAAYKRVPEAERETAACVGANVVGSMNVIHEAIRAGVREVIGISTDKACQPINAYGQSKALMERLFQSAARAYGSTAFHLVRYGNVLASRGSVIPALRAQAARGGIITITDPTMTRFWLSLDDAVDLVLAARELESGNILIPACHASDLVTMAEAVAPGAEIEVVGVRDAEKQHESLLSVHEAPYAEAFKGGWVLHPLTGEPTPGASCYSSDIAPQLTVEDFRQVVRLMDIGAAFRILPEVSVA